MAGFQLLWPKKFYMGLPHWMDPEIFVLCQIPFSMQSSHLSKLDLWDSMGAL